MKITARIEGVDELRDKLAWLRQGARGALAEAAMAGAEVLRDEARRRAPGPYIGAEVVKKTTTKAEANVGPDAEHWYYQFKESGVQAHEIGPALKRALEFYGDEELLVRGQVEHPGMPAEPFLRPAFDTAWPRARDAAGEKLRVAIARAALGRVFGG